MYTNIRTRQTNRQTDRHTHTRVTLGHTKHVLLWIYGSEVDQEHCKRKQTHVLPIPITSLTSCKGQLIYTTHTNKHTYPTWEMTHWNRSGRWLAQAHTRSPPLLPPWIASLQWTRATPVLIVTLCVVYGWGWSDSKNIYGSYNSISLNESAQLLFVPSCHKR